MPGFGSRWRASLAGSAGPPPPPPRRRSPPRSRDAARTGGSARGSGWGAVRRTLCWVETTGVPQLTPASTPTTSEVLRCVLIRSNCSRRTKRSSRRSSRGARRAPAASGLVIAKLTSRVPVACRAPSSTESGSSAQGGDRDLDRAAGGGVRQSYHQPLGASDTERVDDVEHPKRSCCGPGNGGDRGGATETGRHEAHGPHRHAPVGLGHGTTG